MAWCTRVVVHGTPHGWWYIHPYRVSGPMGQPARVAQPASPGHKASPRPATWPATKPTGWPATWPATKPTVSSWTPDRTTTTGTMVFEAMILCRSGDSFCIFCKNTLFKARGPVLFAKNHVFDRFLTSKMAENGYFWPFLAIFSQNWDFLWLFIGGFEPFWQKVTFSSKWPFSAPLAILNVKRYYKISEKRQKCQKLTKPLSRPPKIE